MAAARGAPDFSWDPAHSRASADRRGLASDHRHLLGRVAFALDLDPRGCIRDGAQIFLRQFDLRGADILLEPGSFVVPGIGAMVGRWASSHASAI